MYKPKYKEGDIVKIKDNLNVNMTNVVDGMLRYAGKYVTITSCYDSRTEDNCYHIEAENWWSWGDNMIDHNNELDYEVF